MRMRLLILTLGLAVLLTGCSPSRLTDSERMLSPGNNKHGTIFRSDLLIPAGSALDVAFSSENRFYVATGGRLNGFQKGGRSTKIYSEKGAQLPDARYLKGTRVTTVKSAADAYRKRHDPLPPLPFRPSMMGGSSSDNDDDDDDDDDRSSRHSSPSSVTPSSYQKKN
jgi:hypothetical protein